jgi:Asp/Glu/hydantoin racemase
MFPETKKMPQFGFGQGIGIIVWKVWYPALMHGHHNYATTYNFPVRIKFLENFRVPDNEFGEGSKWNLPGYIECARQLEKEGVAAICTNCGLTGNMQEDIANAVDTPVFTSSLMQVPFVSRSLKKGKKVGILVAIGEQVRANDYKTLKACGIDESTPYILRAMTESADSPESKAAETFLSMARPDFDPKKVEAVIVSEVKKMVSENPEIGAIVLECTEMPLFAAAVREATGLLVFDSSTMVRYVYHAIVKKHYF